MRFRKNKRILSALTTLLLCIAAGTVFAAPDSNGFLAEEAPQIVVLYRKLQQTDVLQNASDVQTELVGEQVALLQTENASQAETLLDTLREDPRVLAADYDSEIELLELPNDPYVSAGSAWHFEKIGAAQTWNRVSGAPVVVAVIDSGLDTAHPDLRGRIAPGYDCITDSSGVVDLVGHGTMVCGCIAAIANNGIGVAGVSGTANVCVAPFRAGGQSAGVNSVKISKVVAAITKILNERPDIQIVNMSFGSTTQYETLEAAVSLLVQSGRVVVASAGNHGSGIPLYPASYDGVISVSATTQADDTESHSGHNRYVDISAPGQQIISTYRGGGYSMMNGTSFSAPIVAAGAAVLLSKSPALSARQVENALRVTSLDLGAPGQDDYFGAGRLRLDRALAYDHSAGALTISNRVAGRYGEESKPFTFTLSLTAEGSYPYSGSRSGMIAHGGYITLKSDEAVTVTQLPTQAVYSVTELEANQDGYTTSATGAAGSITTQGVTAAFVNQKGEIVPTPTPKENTPSSTLSSAPDGKAPTVFWHADGQLDFSLSVSPAAKPTQVFADGKPLKASTDYRYVVKDGRLTLALLPSFTQTLKNGIHTLRALFSNGDIFETDFEAGTLQMQSVAEVPVTGDGGGAALCALALCLGCAAFRKRCA